MADAMIGRLRITIERPAGTPYKEIDEIRTKVFSAVKKSEYFKRLKKGGTVTSTFEGNRVTLTVSEPPKRKKARQPNEGLAG